MQNRLEERMHLTRLTSMDEKVAGQAGLDLVGVEKAREICHMSSERTAAGAMCKELSAADARVLVSDVCRSCIAQAIMTAKDARPKNRNEELRSKDDAPLEAGKVLPF